MPQRGIRTERPHVEAGYGPEAYPSSVNMCGHRVTRSPRRTTHSSVLSHLPIRVAQQCNGSERCTDTRLMTSVRAKQKDTYVKRHLSKTVGKVGAKARETSKASLTRREESGPQQPHVVPAKRVDRTNSEPLQVGRDAKTGRFITVKAAKRRPKTAVVETINKK